MKLNYVQLKLFSEEEMRSLVVILPTKTLTGFSPKPKDPKTFNLDGLENKH